MEKATFIRLENSLEKAMYYRNSPNMSVYSFNGVQLLPKQLYPYTQRTYASEGIELEDIQEVLIMNMCDEEIGNANSSFSIVNNFQDPATGLPQIHWSLTNMSGDFGSQMIYLKIRQGVNNFIYSSPFMITADNADYTSVWHYRDELSETMLSTQLQIWYKQADDIEEVNVYDLVSDDRRVAMSSKLIPYEVWQSKVVEYGLFRQFKRMRRHNYVYCDFAKTTPFEALETRRLVGKENFTDAEILLSRDEDNIYNPFYVAPTPPPVVLVPTITLTTVVSTGINNVSFTAFTYANMIPVTFIYQYSLDQVNWIEGQTAGGITPPQNLFAPNNVAQNYFYRIVDPATETESNVVQLPQPTYRLILEEVISLQGSYNPNGTKYRFRYSYEGFNPTTQFVFEGSTDGDVWEVLNTTQFISSPKDVVSTMQDEPIHFRMRYVPLNLTSNVYDYTI